MSHEKVSLFQFEMTSLVKGNKSSLLLDDTEACFHLTASFHKTTRLCAFHSSYFECTPFSGFVEFSYPCSQSTEPRILFYFANNNVTQVTCFLICIFSLWILRKIVSADLIPSTMFTKGSMHFCCRSIKNDLLDALSHTAQVHICWKSLYGSHCRCCPRILHNHYCHLQTDCLVVCKTIKIVPRV